MHRVVLLMAGLALAPARLAYAQDTADAPAAGAIDVELLGSVGYLTDASSHGAALDAGLRLGLGRYFALGLDVGYGVIAGARAEDRWWIMPTAAFVLEADGARLDVGAGIGLGAASGYASFDAFVDAPFDPDWAFQLAPALRAHAMLATPIGTSASAFLRVEAGMLWVDDNELGVRERTNELSSHDTIWVATSVGVAVDLLGE